MTRQRFVVFMTNNRLNTSFYSIVMLKIMQAFHNRVIHEFGVF